MKITARKYYFQTGLDKAFSVVNKATPHNAFLYVFVTAREGEVRFVGSDGSLTLVSVTQDITVEEEGSGLVPVKVHDYIKLCPDIELTLTVEEEAVHVTYEGSRLDCPIESLEYPDDYQRPEEWHMVPKGELQAALARCRPAIASESLQAVFSFVQVGKQVMRATDGFKLHQVAFPYPIEALLPSRAVPEILRRIRAMTGNEVSAGQDKGHYYFEFDAGDLLVITKHVTSYPDIDAHLLTPALRNDQPLVILRQEVIDAVKRVSLATDSRTNYLSLSLRSDHVLVEAVDRQGTLCREQISAEWKGPNRTLGLNSDFLMDVLSATAGRKLTIMLGKDALPRLSSLCFHDEGFTGVLLQLRAGLIKEEATPEEAPRRRRRAKEPVPDGNMEDAVNALFQEE